MPISRVAIPTPGHSFPDLTAGSGDDVCKLGGFFSLIRSSEQTVSASSPYLLVSSPSLHKIRHGIEKPREIDETRFYLSLMKIGISKIEGVGTPDLGSLVGEVILTVDGALRKITHKPSKEHAGRAASGIEMLVTSIQGERVKLGRNEPCYCGSGKKYKKCHGK